MSNSTQQNKIFNRSTILALAVAGVLGLTHASAEAQQRVDRSGANDANNRVGSNGRNDTRAPRQNPWEVNNAIVYGNVTGGKQFRGNLSSRDAREFRGNTANRQMDNFVRDSAGVTTGGIETFNANRTRAFFGDGRGVAPPPGFVGVNSLGAYTTPRATPWRTVDPRKQAISAGIDTTVVRPDQFGAPGAVDLQYGPGGVLQVDGARGHRGLAVRSAAIDQSVAALRLHATQPHRPVGPRAERPRRTPRPRPQPGRRRGSARQSRERKPGR